MAVDQDRVTKQEFGTARIRPGEPVPVHAYYDCAGDRLIIVMNNGVEIAVPRRTVRGIAEARPDQLGEAEIAGCSVYWPGADELLDIQETVIDLFDIRTHLARIAASVRTPATAAASRRNGAKGGRPRKVMALSPETALSG